jgi:hypothetical protein
VIYIFLQEKKKVDLKNIKTHNFFPWFQYNVPNIKADARECVIRIKLYAGFLQ